VKRDGRSKPERIKVKMELCSSVGLRNTKSILGVPREGNRENTVASQKYTPVFRARAGSLKYIFFFNINRVLGLISIL
jgi:hypothetical protein